MALRRASDVGRSSASLRRTLVVVALAVALLAVAQLAGIAATGGLLPRAVAPAPAAAAACVNGWRELDLPADAFSRSLFSIVSYNGRPKWLLGGSHRSGALALRKKNGKWRRVELAGTGTRGFTAGSAMTARKTFAVGYVNPRNAPLSPIGGRLNTKGFRDFGVPRGSVHGASLADVVGLGRKRAWAVGVRWLRGRSVGTALVWNGKRWQRRDPPIGRGESGLTAIDAAPGGSVWAVGWREKDRGEFRPLIRRRTGSGWKKVAAARVPNGSAVLTDVEFRARDRGWLTGYVVRRGSGDYDPILQRWDGDAWSTVGLPWDDGESRIIRAIATGDGGALWLAGVRLPKSNTEGRGFVATRIDGTWNVQELDVPGSVASDLRDIAVTQVGAIAVGAIGSTTFGMETCGAGPAAVGDGRIAVSRVAARIAVPPVEDHEEDPIRDPAGGSFRSAGLGNPKRSNDVRFVDRASQAGIAETTKTWDGTVSDVDEDGWRDIWFSRHLVRQPRMLLGGPNGFTRAPEQPWTIGDRHGCDAADIDKDDAKEMFCAFGGARGTGVGRHEVSLRVGKGNAEVRRNARGAYDPFGRGRNAAFVNLDGDGYPDLFITNHPERVDGLPSTNRFFRNVGGTFVPAPGQGLDHSTGGKCLWTGDFDGDGDGDILHCVTRPDDGLPAGLRLYRNENGRFRDRTVGQDIRPIGDIAVALADVTGDGRKDLIQLSKKRIRVSRGTPRGFRRIWQASLSDAIDVATGDVDGNGRADLYILRGGNRNTPDRLLVNRNRGRRWVNVKIPTTRKGDADAVLAIDHDKNGRTDFVVLNGKTKPGPIQLIAAYPR